MSGKRRLVSDDDDFHPSDIIASSDSSELSGDSNYPTEYDEASDCVDDVGPGEDDTVGYLDSDDVSVQDVPNTVEVIQDRSSKRRKPRKAKKARDKTLYPQLGINEYPVPPPRGPCPDMPSDKEWNDLSEFVRESYARRCLGGGRRIRVNARMKDLGAPKYKSPGIARKNSEEDAATKLRRMKTRMEGLLQLPPSDHDRKLNPVIDVGKADRLFFLRESAQVDDVDGTPLVAYFTGIPDGKLRPKSKHPTPWMPHGLSVRMQEYLHFITQELLSQVPPLGQVKRRHEGNPPWTIYSVAPDENGPFVDRACTNPSKFTGENDPYSVIQRPDRVLGQRIERNGVLHMVHAWPMVGHEKTDLMTPSVSMIGKTMKHHVASEVFMDRTAGLHNLLSDLFEMAFPEEHDKYRKAFDAAHCAMPDGSRAAWLARAVLWAMQTTLHLDDGDGVDAICGLVNNGFCGAEDPDSDYGMAIVFPEINMAFSYKPGDMLIFRSATLYHAVLRWKPLTQVWGMTTSPCRSSFVFFSPGFTMRWAKGKRRNEGISTGWKGLYRYMKCKPRNARRGKKGFAAS